MAKRKAKGHKKLFIAITIVAIVIVGGAILYSYGVVEMVEEALVGLVRGLGGISPT